MKSGGMMGDAKVPDTTYSANLCSSKLRNPLDSLAWVRMGRPEAGNWEVLKRDTYPLEYGADLITRVETRFGDPSDLSVADLGAGTGESFIARQVQQAPWRRLHSVEAFEPYVSKLSEKNFQASEHTIDCQLIQNAIRGFQPGEFDLILLIDVLEHFPRRAALNLLVRLERLARIGIVIFVPLGHVVVEVVDGNYLQTHRSFWNGGELLGFGYDVICCEGIHCHLNPIADGAWAMKSLKNADSPRDLSTHSKVCKRPRLEPVSRLT